MTEIGFGQLFFLVVVIALSIAFGLGDVTTAQVGQGLCLAWYLPGFYLGWSRLPKVPAARSWNDSMENGEEGRSDAGDNTTTKKKPKLLTIGFLQNWNTVKRINLNYRNSLRWFLLACVFGEAAATAFATVSVVFLTDHLGLDASQVGIVFLISLVSTIVSCKIGDFLTKWTNPNIAWRIAMLYLFGVALVGAFSLSRDNAIPYSFVWSFFIGLGLGANYQVQYVYIGMVTPKGQEAELAGFFNYCRLILMWLPPLIFTLLVEAGVSQSIGVAVCGSFFIIAVGMLSMSASWEEVLEEVHGSSYGSQL